MPWPTGSHVWSLCSRRPRNLKAMATSRTRKEVGALRQKYVSKPGHHGHFRGARLAAPSGRDLWIEPSPVAVAIADLARRSGFAVTICAPSAKQAAFSDADRRIEGFALPVDEAAARYVVVSTQGGATRRHSQQH